MKNKKNLIAIVLCIIAIFLIIYIKTDILKTKEQLFWKYMCIETNKISRILSNEDIKKYNQDFNKSKYVKQVEVSFKSKYNIIKPININITEKGDNQLDIMNANIDISYDNKDFEKASIIKDKDYYLIQSNNINEKYICVENNNLKELAKKLGIENVDFIPNKIEKIDYNELFFITNKEKTHIISKYAPIFRKHITNKKYSKEENIKLDSNSNITAYKLEITEKDAYELIIDILSEIKEDEYTLNFISNKIKIVDESSKYCEIENIKGQIDKWLIDFNSKKEIIEAENKKILSIIIYKNQKDILKVEFILNDNRTISLQLNKEENKIVLNQYDVSNRNNKLDNIEGIILTILNNISEIDYSRNIEDNRINHTEINIICEIALEKFELKYKSSEKLEEHIDNIIGKDDVEFLELKDVFGDTYF